MTGNFSAVEMLATMRLSPTSVIDVVAQWVGRWSRRSLRFSPHDFPFLSTALPGPSTSGVTTLWRYTNIIIIFFYIPGIV